MTLGELLRRFGKICQWLCITTALVILLFGGVVAAFGDNHALAIVIPSLAAVVAVLLLGLSFLIKVLVDFR